MTTRRQSIAKPPMEDSYGRLHRNIDVREIKQVVNILHIHRNPPKIEILEITLLEAENPQLSLENQTGNLNHHHPPGRVHPQAHQ